MGLKEGIDAMGKETMFEELGIEYKERDGILYPILDDVVDDEKNNIGKYGILWVRYLEITYPQRYRSLVRFSRLKDKAIEVNEMAYELLDDIEAKFLGKRKAVNTNSFMEMYQLRMEARILAEEVVLHDIVHKYH